MSYCYCNDCSEIFAADEAKYRKAELEDSRPPGTEIMLCPYCGSEDISEADECERCGAPIPPDEHLCECCEDDLYGAVKDIIYTFQGDSLDAKDHFFDYLERRWY